MAAPGLSSQVSYTTTISNFQSQQHQQPQRPQFRIGDTRRRKNGCMDIMEEDHHPNDDSSPKLPSLSQSLRYNNIRPNYTVHHRVPERLYPDPTKYGWKFTGSTAGATVSARAQDMAEFFERESEHGRIHLDFYFHSGTIQVVLMNPNPNDLEGGEMQLFKKGRSLLPDIYRNVLDDPILNTDAKFRRSGTPRMTM